MVQRIATLGEERTDRAERIAYPVAEAAEAIGMSRDVLYRHIRAGELPAFKLGSRMLVLRRDILALIERHPA